MVPLGKVGSTCQTHVALAPFGAFGTVSVVNVPIGPSDLPAFGTFDTPGELNVPRGFAQVCDWHD